MPFAPQEVVETQATCGLQIIIEELAHALLLEFCHPRNQRQAHRPMSSSSTISQASDTFAAMTDDHRLAEFIREQASAMRVVIQARKRLSGGAIQENWLLDLLIEGGPWAGDRRWVLRSDALSALPASLDRAQEFAVLQVAHQAGVKVPRPLWLCRDTQVNGRVFFLMEYVAGVAAGWRLSSAAGALG